MEIFQVSFKIEGESDEVVNPVWALVESENSETAKSMALEVLAIEYEHPTSDFIWLATNADGAEYTDIASEHPLYPGVWL